MGLGSSDPMFSMIQPGMVYLVTGCFGFVLFKKSYGTQQYLGKVCQIETAIYLKQTQKIKSKEKKRKIKKKNLQAEFRDMNSIYKWFEDE